MNMCREKEMIKSFIYLDEQKMYSLSSQIFEGITEYVLNESGGESQDSESQKGPVGSGRTLANVIKSSSKSTEKKFLHDYSLSIFERYLMEEGRILDLSGPDVDMESLKLSVNDYSFVKVRARAVFNDAHKIIELFTEFNEIGQALAHMGAQEKISEARAKIDEIKSLGGSKSKIAAIEAEFKKMTNLSSLAKAGGLYQDPKFLSDAALLIKYGFSDQFEIKQKLNDVMFTSCLKRKFLREEVDLLVKKYSRKTDRDIVVFGVISQTFTTNELEIDDDAEYPNMKAGLMMMVEHLAQIEHSISGKQNNEIVIDPIAAYFEV